jgi:yecA family protein
MREPDFDTLSRVLDRLEAGVGAAELDGTLAGFLCAGGAATADRWLPSLALAELDESLDDARDRDLFGTWYRRLSHALDDPELGFAPLLPEDDAPIAERAAAMVEWCRGFLGGLGLAGVDLGKGISGDGAEVVGDFGRIAATEFDPGESEADDEEAYAEMVEYIRVGVMLLHQQFAQAQPEATRH